MYNVLIVDYTTENLDILMEILKDEYNVKIAEKLFQILLK